MKYLILDGNSILNRAFYGIKILSNKEGQMTNAIYGFLSTLQKLLNEVSPEAVVIAFDVKKPTFRHKMYSGYKSSRKGMPEELASQVPILKDLLKAMGYHLISCEGYEADDILGTFAQYCDQKNYSCVLATGDRDSLQLISKNVSVRIAKTKFGKAESILYDSEKVKEEYGVTPDQLVDIKALQGDTSDCIPGVMGIGEKTARDLISRFGNIDYIYKNLENLDIKENLKLKLKNGKETAFLSYDLGKINKHVPINIADEENIPQKQNTQEVKKILTRLEFYSFIEKMNLSDVNTIEEFVSFDKNFDNFLKMVDTVKEVSLLFDKNNNSFYVFHDKKIYKVLAENSQINNFFVDVLENKTISKNIYDLKSLTKFLDSKNVTLLGTVFDVMLAAYLIEPSAKEYTLLKLADEYNIPNVKVVENLDETDTEILKTIYSIHALSKILKNKIIENNQSYLLQEVEQPLAKILAKMENAGFCIDKSGLKSYGLELKTQINSAESEIYLSAGCTFNINSPKQLGNILFEKLMLPKGKKTKNGYSTNAQVLEKLKSVHPIIDQILEYRALVKLKSTYIDSILELVDKDEKIHSSFNQIETRTGRISSAEPNLQNIPVRTERGRQLRKYFKASPGSVLVDADYSQIELRVMAHISGDENMIAAFKNDEDIHTITASQIFGVPTEMVTKEMRFRSKTVNFGILYGMSAFSLAQELKISNYEAKNYINRYLEHYKGIDNYMKNVISEASKKGYVETIFHRKRYLPELSSPNHILKSFGERVARNMPIQGSAADIIKISMINVCKELQKRGLGAKLILQVHDELIIDSPNSEIDVVKDILKKEMENAVKLKIPLKVHIAVGKTWFDAKD